MDRKASEWESKWRQMKKRKAWIINLIFRLCNQCLWSWNCHFWHGSNCFWPVAAPLTHEREVVEHRWSVSEAPESRTRPPFRSSSPTADYDQQQKFGLVQHYVLFKSNLDSAKLIWLRWKLWLQETPRPQKYVFLSRSRWFSGKPVGKFHGGCKRMHPPDLIRINYETVPSQSLKIMYKM